MKNIGIFLSLSAMLLGGCAHIKFNADPDAGLTYFEPNPLLFVTRILTPVRALSRLPQW